MRRAQLLAAFTFSDSHNFFGDSRLTVPRLVLDTVMTCGLS